MSQNITTAVITGGPGAGKTSALKEIRNHFNKKGYEVYCMPETATELINGGIAPWTCPTNKDFQKLLFDLQLKKEAIYHQAAEEKKADKTLIVFDRGLVDNHCYLKDDEFQEILDGQHMSEKDLLKRYDHVFHMECAAKGDPQWYSVDNNEARMENQEQAIALDDRILEVWKNHPDFVSIPAARTIEEKIGELLEKMDEKIPE